MREQPNKIDAKFVRGFIRRQIKLFLVISSLVLSLSIALAFTLPKVYVSTATILIEGQIAGELLKGISMGFIEERLQVITQQILTRDKLTQILQKLNLLPETPDAQSIDAILTGVRKNIELKTIKAGDFERSSYMPVQTTVAFTLSYSSEDPAIAYKVAKEISSLYVQKNLERKEQITNQATAVLKEKLNKMQEQTGFIEKKLNDFKRNHAGELPENMAFNLEQIYRLNLQLEDVNARIKNLEDVKSGTAGQQANSRMLSGDPRSNDQASNDPWIRLSQLRTHLVSLQSRYSDKHPDVRKTKSEIQRLEVQLGIADQKERELEGLKKRLEEMKGTPGADRAEVAKLSEDISLLSRQVEEGKRNQGKKSTKSPEEELNRQIQRREDIQRKINEFTRKTQVSTMVQQEYNKLIQEYENSSKQYNETLAKLTDAKVAKEIEDVQLGERFTVIEEPQIPRHPTKPDKRKIILGGIFLALCAGLFASVAQENMDHSIKSPEQLQKITKLPVLTVLPYVQTDEERSRKAKGSMIEKIYQNIVKKVLNPYPGTDRKT
jgi:polysaccharide chain length determinant protein (PEP-CTERM system associated)